MSAFNSIHGLEDLPGYGNGIVGQTVEWELSGRGRGTIQQGICVAVVEPGTTNADAIREVQQTLGLHVRKKYIRCDPETVSTRRYLVLVKQDSKRIRKVYWIYGPNVDEATVVK